MSPGRILAVLCIMLCGVSSAMAQSAYSATAKWGLPELMQELAQVKSASARFTERKTMHMLKVPLVTSGTLKYVAPDHVEKITLFPEHERFVLSGNRVTITGKKDHGTHTFLLTQDPQIAGLVEGIRATLAGDLPTLERFYSVHFSGDGAQWRLLLKPKDAELAHFIKWLRISGHADRIEAIDTESANGDHSEMTVIEDMIDVR